MHRRVLYFGLLAMILLLPGHLAAQSFTIAPSTVRTAPDYATDVLADPWDFEQASDYAYMFSIDDTRVGECVNMGPACPQGYSSAWTTVPSMIAGHFFGTSRVAMPRLQLLFEGNDGALNVIGRNGARFPIDTSRFRRLSLRMRRTQMPPDTMQATWFTRSVRQPGTVGGQMVATQSFDPIAARYINQSPVAEQGSTGWHIYKIDLAATHPHVYGVSYTAGPVRGLRLDLGNSSQMIGSDIEIDWVRLSEPGVAYVSLALSGFGSPVTLTARHQETGDVVQIFPDNGTNATTFNDNSIASWDVGYLSPGTWVVTARNNNNRSVTKTLVINPAPIIEIVDPDESGGRDYGRTVVGDAYDMTNSHDVTRDGWMRELNGVAFSESGMTATTAGNTTTPWPDPFVYLLDDSSRRPGTERIIDATEYRHLTFTLEYDRKELTWPEAWTGQYGSIARVIWRAAGKNGGALTNTQDILVPGGGPITYSMDLGAFTQFGDCTMCQLEAGHGTDLWQGQIAVFRIDPYESDTQRWFRLADIRLTADDEPNGNGFFTIRWRVSDATFSREVAGSAPSGSDATMSLYYDIDTNPSSGRVLIASNVPADLGAYSWNVTGLPVGRYFVYAVVTDTTGNTQARYSTGPVRISGVYPEQIDRSGTGMPDAWRAAYGVSDPNADADGDGVTNLDEYQLATDPLVSNRWNLPEGATGYFTERIALANPDPAPANITITYLRKAGPPIVRDYSVLGYGRLTVTTNEVAGLASEEFSAVITTNTGAVVAERTMFWGDRWYGGHTGKAVQTARTRWFFAEGDAGFFETWILLANATSATAHVQITYLLPGGGTIVRQYTVDPQTRFTVYANQVPGLAGKSFSGDISSDVPITVERSMYFSGGGRFWTGGHAAAAVEAPATSWFVAEGRTGPFFDTYLLLANPNASAATARVRYLMPDRVYRDVDYALEPYSRRTLMVDAELEALGFRDTDVSARVTSDLPIIVERAMYWPGDASQWLEAHDSAGVTSTGTTWVLAEGELGGGLAFDTYILFANPSDTDATVRTRVLRASGVPTDTTFTVPANSRATMQASMIGAKPGEQFGLRIDSLNGVPIVVERAMYWNGGGQFWGGGTNETAFKVK